MNLRSCPWCAQCLCSPCSQHNHCLKLPAFTLPKVSIENALHCFHCLSSNTKSLKHPCLQTLHNLNNWFMAKDGNVAVASTNNILYFIPERYHRDSYVPTMCFSKDDCSHLYEMETVKTLLTAHTHRMHVNVHSY